MKTIRLSIFVISIMFIGISAKTPKISTKPFTNVKEVEKEIVKIKEGLYMSKFEVSNRQYTAFINNLKNKGDINSLKIANIDSLGWIARNKYNEPYVELYHKHITFQNNSVVNISYQGAVMFCEWLSEQYNSLPNKKFNKVKFRLPTETEWELGARASNDTSVKYIIPLTCDRGPTANYLYVPQESIRKDGIGDINGINYSLYKKKKFLSYSNADIITPVNSYYPNKLGIFNVHGNVEEMIEGGLITKGGCWRDFGYNLQLDQNKENQAPNDHTGFRFVMEIIE